MKLNQLNLVLFVKNITLFLEFVGIIILRL